MFTYQLESNFQDRLSTLCDESPMSDSDIARALEISKQTLSAWKCGTRSPKRPTIETIARFFSVTVDWLMGFDSPKSPDQEKPVEQYDELDEKGADLLTLLTPQEFARVLDFAAGLLAARSDESSHHD